MEHLVVSELTEKLSCMLTQKLFQEVWLVTNFKDDFEFICNEVNSIKCLLSDVRGNRTAHYSSMSNWLNELEDFLIDAVDIVEECQYPKFKLINFLKVIYVRYGMGRKIRTLKERITRIHMGAKYLKYLTSLTANAGVQALDAYVASSEEDKRRKSNAIRSQFHSVGIQESIDEVTKWILEERFKAIAVVGMGGQGKTCLVQDVFNSSKVRDHFDHHMVWLTVSPKYDVKQLLLTTWSQIKLPDDQKLSELSEKDLRSIINEHLQKKDKYLERKNLFVLDDVWDGHVWEQLGLQLDHQSSDIKNKNKVVVTTRDMGVAQKIRADYTHRMKLLSDNESWELFCNHANLPENLPWNPPSLENEHPTSVTSIAQLIVKKCSGLPLAIKTIGASMASARRIPNEWELTFHRLNEADPITDSVMPSLRLSYEGLPDPLKPCFLYCSAFPPNTPIKSEYLAQAWIAEGFISTPNQEAQEAIYEVALSYIDQLLGRCLIEGSDSSLVRRDWRVKYCKMHDLLHQLALVESRKETKCLLKPGQELKELPVNECHNIRRISLVKNNIEAIKDAMPASACKGLRTLLLYNNLKLTSISEDFFENLKYLAVLDLSQTSITSLPTSIGKLRRLKFLNLSETKIEKLPKSLSCLKRLQFLDVSGCQQLSSLHSGIEEHTFMMYLNVKGCGRLKWLPAGISKLVYLRTLKGANLVFKGDQLKEADAALQWTDLKGLTRLQHLSITIDAPSESQGEGRITLEGTFRGMTNMRTLSLRNISSSGRLLHLPNDTERMERLEILRLRNCAVPTWMSQLQNIMVLVLEGDNYSAEYKGVQRIPNLKELRLSRNSKCDQFPSEFGERMAFSQLERLIIEDFESLEIFYGAMPTLKYLRFKNCKLLKLLPGQALEKLTSLKEIEVEYCPIWEDGFWNGVDRDSTWKIFNDRGIKLTIDNFTISVERNIENENKLKSAKEIFSFSMTRNSSGRRWNLFSSKT